MTKGETRSTLCHSPWATWLQTRELRQFYKLHSQYRKWGKLMAFSIKWMSSRTADQQSYKIGKWVFLFDLHFVSSWFTCATQPTASFSATQQRKQIPLKKKYLLELTFLITSLSNASSLLLAFSQHWKIFPSFLSLWFWLPEYSCYMKLLYKDEPWRLPGDLSITLKN